MLARVPRNHRAPTPPLRTLGDKLHHLAFLAPNDVAAIEVIVDDLLARRIDEAKATVYPVLRWPPKDE